MTKRKKAKKADLPAQPETVPITPRLLTIHGAAAYLSSTP
jgi:hypothetical protein